MAGGSLSMTWIGLRHLEIVAVFYGRTEDRGPYVEIFCPNKLASQTFVRLARVRSRGSHGRSDPQYRALVPPRTAADRDMLVTVPRCSVRLFAALRQFSPPLATPVATLASEFASVAPRRAQLP